MKYARDLGRAQLEAIVTIVQNRLYLTTVDDTERLVYDPDKDVNGGDLVDALTEAMRRYGLTPGEITVPGGD